MGWSINRSRRAATAVSAALMLALGTACIGNAAWIHAKALLAQYLIADAWQQTLASGTAVKPWPWADTWPAGHLQLQKYAVDLYTLSGLGGNALAFGPGQLAIDTAAGVPSYLIAGHRDTHFHFMKQLVPGDTLEFTDRRGRGGVYRVVALEVVDSRYQPLQSDAAHRQLILVTCYPFDAPSAGGPLRYVARAEPVGQTMQL